MSGAIVEDNPGTAGESREDRARRGIGESVAPPAPWHTGLFLALIAWFVLLTMESIRSTPVVVDEYGHVPAGVSHWHLGDFQIYRENPPLVRSLSALPVWLSGAKIDYTRLGLGRRSEFQVGVDFVRGNGRYQQFYFELARLVILFLSVACAALIFWWSGENHGGAAAVVSSAVWLTDPSVVAHSGLATLDIGTAAFCALASYAYWCYLRRACWSWAVVSGITLGLAQACKFSMLVLYPAWWLLALAARWSLRREEAVRTPEAGPTFPQVAVICAISFLVLNAIYGFDGTGKPIGSFSFRSHLLTGKQTRSVDEPPAANRFRGTWVGTFPCPLPKHYVLGFDSQKWEEEGNFVRLLDGNLVQRGRWYSPLTTTAYKLPLGSIALLGLSAVFWVVRSRRVKLVELAILVPAFFVVGLMCTQTGLNWLYRYTLPALPLLCVAIGRPVQLLWRSRSFRFFVIACLVWNGIGIFRVRPNYFAYGNELIGGPAGAQRVFLGSNFDWGQDLYRFKQWYAEHSGMRPLLMTYYGVLEPHDLGIRDRGIPARFL